MVKVLTKKAKTKHQGVKTDKQNPDVRFVKDVVSINFSNIETGVAQ